MNGVTRLLLLVAAAPLSAVHAQSEQALSPPAAGASPVAAPTASISPTVADEAVPTHATLLVPRDTPVHLMVLKEVTTKSDSAGERFKLRVIEPVVIDGKTAIPVGSTAWGEVTSAESSGNLGKSGRLSARLLYVEVGGVPIRIDGQTTAKGNSGTAETVVGVLSLGVLGLFAKGNNAKIKAGEQMTAFTAEDANVPEATRS